MKKSISWLIVISLTGTLYINFLAATVGINGQLTGAISDKYPTLFAPAGYVFSIWSLIYLGLMAFTGMVIFAPKKIPKGLGELFILTNFLNAFWMLSWHFDALFLSVLIMSGLLVTLIKINNLIFGQKKLDLPARWLMKYPFELYLGWISVATIANVSVWLSAANWQGFGFPPLYWAMMMAAVALIVSMIRLLVRHDYVFPMVIAWALWGIRYKQISNLVFASWIVGLELALGVGLVYGLYRKINHQWR